MNIIKYPSAESVNDAMKNDEPLLAAIAFDIGINIPQP